MRKYWVLILYLLLSAGSLYAGIHFGMPGAVKERVRVLDARVQGGCRPKGKAYGSPLHNRQPPRRIIARLWLCRVSIRRADLPVPGLCCRRRCPSLLRRVPTVQRRRSVHSVNRHPSGGDRAVVRGDRVPFAHLATATWPAI